MAEPKEGDIIRYTDGSIYILGARADRARRGEEEKRWNIAGVILETDADWFAKGQDALKLQVQLRREYFEVIGEIDL